MKGNHELIESVVGSVCWLVRDGSSSGKFGFVRVTLSAFAAIRRNLAAQLQSIATDWTFSRNAGANGRAARELSFARTVASAKT